MQAITTIGFDIAKSVFQVHGVDAAGQVIVRRQLKRRQRQATEERYGRRVQVAEWSNHCSLLREREIAAISTLVFDSCRSRCPTDLSKSAQLQLSKNAEISGDYKFRTKTAKYRALEKNAWRERISDLSESLAVQRFAD